MSKVKAAIAAILGRIKDAARTYHARAQVARLVRLFVVAVGTTGIVDKFLSGGATRTAVIGAIVGASEVAVRQWVSPSVPGAIVNALIARIHQLETRLSTHVDHVNAAVAAATPPAADAPKQA